MLWTTRQLAGEWGWGNWGGPKWAQKKRIGDLDKILSRRRDEMKGGGEVRTDGWSGVVCSDLVALEMRKDAMRFDTRLDRAGLCKFVHRRHRQGLRCDR